MYFLASLFAIASLMTSTFGNTNDTQCPAVSASNASNASNARNAGMQNWEGSCRVVSGRGFSWPGKEGFGRRGLHGFDFFEVAPFEIFASSVGIPGIDVQEHFAETEVA